MMVTSSTTQTQPSSECCMCGDFGLSFELFRCKICQFRSQHRYCSNQYPKAESYRVCNWCLSYEKDDDSAMEKTQNSSDSSSSYRANNTDQIDEQTNPHKKKITNSDGRRLRDRIRRSSSNLQIPVRKQRSPEQQSPAGRKRILTIGAAMEESSSNGGRVMMRRSKSDHEILLSNIGGGVGGGVGGGGGHAIKTKHVYRNKVRRYKLLDEVSSQ